LTCRPILIRKRLSSHEFRDLLKTCHNGSCRPREDYSQLDGLWLRELLPMSHNHYTVSKRQRFRYIDKHFCFWPP
jgi:hypothetical protein